MSRCAPNRLKEVNTVAKIISVETLLIHLPTRREHKWTGLTEPIGRYILTRITSNDGVVGWGEAPALKDWGGEFGRYFGESPAITETVIKEYLGPAITDIEVGNIVEAHSRMDKVIKGYPYAKAAIETALYDLAGRSLNCPVHTLLGGCARNRIPVTHSIGLLDIDIAEKESATVVKEGIKTIKIKVGVDPERDVEIVRRIRAAVGPDINLCVDANEGYKTPGDAIRTIKKMEQHNLIYVEQPVTGIERNAQVAKAIDTSLMLDESAWNSHDVIQIIEARAADIVSIYTTKPGGLFRAMEVAAVCRAAGIICNVNGSVETGLGNLANLQLAAAAPSVVLSCVVPVSTPAEAQAGQIAGIYYSDDLLEKGMTFSDGSIELPTGNGMGLDVDLNKIEQYKAT